MKLADYYGPVIPAVWLYGFRRIYPERSFPPRPLSRQMRAALDQRDDDGNWEWSSGVGDIYWTVEDMLRWGRIWPRV